MYFWNKTLHVSDSSSVHHHEFFYCKHSNTYRFVDSLRAVNKPVWHIPLLCLPWNALDGRRRNYPKQKYIWEISASLIAIWEQMNSSFYELQQGISFCSVRWSCKFLSDVGVCLAGTKFATNLSKQCHCWYLKTVRTAFYWMWLNSLSTASKKHVALREFKFSPLR